MPNNQSGQGRHDEPAKDRIDAELERALFRRFWAWLAIVGSVVIVVVSGFSVVASLAVNSLVNEKVDLATNKIKDLEKLALEAAFKVNDAQVRSAVAAEIAKAKSEEGAKAAEVAKAKADEGEKAVLLLKDAIKSVPDVGALVRTTKNAADSLATNPEFMKEVTGRVEARISNLEKSLGGGRILAFVRVKDGKLLYGSPEVTFNDNIVTFRNPKRLAFVPIISDSHEYPYITDTHWIQKIIGTEAFVVMSHALDTGGATRTAPAHNFTAVIIGFGTSDSSEP